MNTLNDHLLNDPALSKSELDQFGFAIVDALYTEKEILDICLAIEEVSRNNDNIQESNDLYAIRQLIGTVPQLKSLIFNESFKKMMSVHFESAYFLTKAIYFDKPSESNWFVSYHQDLSISVKEKVETEGYRNWTFKKGQFGVQPPVEILNSTVTIRIHLDDTDKNNGALRVIPKSHLKGVIRLDVGGIPIHEEICCEVKRGGAMLMKPLTLHASSKTTNGQRRRVIHLEFNNQHLQAPLHWLEYVPLKP